MSISGIKRIQAGRNSRAGRHALGAVLLVALALAVFAVDLQGTLAQVGIQAGFNYISNGSFEKDSNGDGVPNGWLQGDLTSQDRRVCNQSKAGSCSFKLKADTDIKSLGRCKNFSETDAGDQYQLKAWTKNKALVLGGGEVRILVDFYDTDAAVGGEEIWLPGGDTPWTLRQLTLTAAVDYDKICITLQTWAQSGTVWFDKLSLVFVP